MKKSLDSLLYLVTLSGDVEQEAATCTPGQPSPGPVFRVHESLPKATAIVPLWLLTVLDGPVHTFYQPLLHWKDRKAQTGNKTPQSHCECHMNW